MHPTLTKTLIHQSRVPHDPLFNSTIDQNFGTAAADNTNTHHQKTDDQEPSDASSSTAQSDQTTTIFEKFELANQINLIIKYFNNNLTLYQFKQ